VDKNGTAIGLGFKIPVKFQTFKDNTCHHITLEQRFTPYIYPKCGYVATLNNTGVNLIKMQQFL
jgi:hypothetical protein